MVFSQGYSYKEVLIQIRKVYIWHSRVNVFVSVHRQSCGHSVLVMYSLVSVPGGLAGPSEKSPEKVARGEQGSVPVPPWFFSWLLFSPVINENAG